MLRGFDQTTNLILEDCHERVYSTQVCVCVSTRRWIVGQLSASQSMIVRRGADWRDTEGLCWQSGVEMLELGLYVIRGDNV